MAKNVTDVRGEIYYTPNGNGRIKSEPVTPIEEDFGDHNRLDDSFEKNCGYQLRPSMSENNILALRDDLMKQKLNDRHRKTSTSSSSRTKFVSMAEAIYHYQRDTPGRFHSTRPQIFRPQAHSSRTGPTIPQSPLLRSKARSRPMHVISLKEKEEMEMEEIKKHKIKAQPIPKSVIEGPINLPEVPKKPITVPEPFHLTEMPKKMPQSPGYTCHFKARPAPKHILEKPHIPPKPPVQITKPVSPKFHCKKTASADLLKQNNKETQKPHKTEEKHIRVGPVKPEPFSFEKRDEELKKRREERIYRQIEEERKQACSFKAQPVPGAVKKRMQCATVKGSGSATSSENKENFKFEARPPTVLHKEPFKPVLQPMQLIKPAPFALTTEKRAAEREKFDKQLKEKEEEQERLRQQKEQQLKEAEEKAISKLRTKLVHHAKPVPTVTQFIPEKSVNPLTVPETPTFVRRLKQN